MSGARARWGGPRDAKTQPPDSRAPWKLVQPLAWSVHSYPPGKGLAKTDLLSSRMCLGAGGPWSRGPSGRAEESQGTEHRRSGTHRGRTEGEEHVKGCKHLVGPEL